MGRGSRGGGAVALHHARVVANMRSEYDHGRAKTRRDDVSEKSSQGSNSSSEKSYQARRTRSTMSDTSYHTVATEQSADDLVGESLRERCDDPTHRSDLAREPSSLKRADTAPQPRRHQSRDEAIQYQEEPPQYRYFDDRAPQRSPNTSVQSFTSTIAEEDDLDEQLPEFSVPHDMEPIPEASNVIPATPSDFSQLFPSNRSLLIHHDDSTDDGNMNLRVDTEVTINGQFWDMTLFHLRLQDLRNRECSLRRYCRDSGREVCHSSRKQQKQATEKRPGFSRSLSNALTSMRSPSGSKVPTLSRNDSGYGSVRSSGSIDDEWIQSPGQPAKVQEAPLTDTIKLEFSNYAQAAIKRVGSKGNKRYEFEYWNVQYAWRRLVQRDNSGKKISYYLTKNGSDVKLAHITPVRLDANEAELEHDKGGWIPPCRMRIVDKSILSAQKDLSDVVVACGLMALVDDAIRTRLESHAERSLLIPSSVQYIGPKRLINEMFNRKDSGSRPATRPPSSRQSSSRPSTSDGNYTASYATSGPNRRSG